MTPQIVTPETVDESPDRFGFALNISLLVAFAALVLAAVQGWLP